MSAWLCSDLHIAFLAKAAVVHGVTDQPAAEVAAMMKRENLASLAYRYPDHDDDEPTTVDMDTTSVDGNVENPHYVAKLAACYDYQACEHPEYVASVSCRIATALEEVADYSAYEDAEQRRMGLSRITPVLPWGI